MSTIALLHRWLRAARLRRGLDTVLAGLPWAMLAAASAWRWRGLPVAVAVVALVAGVVAVTWRRLRELDTRWLARRLDTQRADMEDSAELLFADASALTGLQRLQQARLQQRLGATPSPELRPHWSTRALTLAAIAVVATAAVLLWPARPPAAFDDVLSRITGGAAVPTQTRLVQQQLRVAPPAYTHQPAQGSAALDAKAPQGTRLQWTLRFAPQPGAAELVFHDGRRLALTRDGDDWRASLVLARSALYRIEPRDAPPLQPQRRYRLDALADRPPQLRVLAPEQSLSLLTRGQRSWSLAFEGSDDYGLAANAQLRITLAQGSGENITFREQTMTVPGRGDATRKRYAAQLDLAALGLAAGDDLIAQLLVHDNRTPQPQSVRSPSLILRWPSDLGTETTGIDGLVKKALPAYFRSQRQIIIDAEALLKRKRSLDGAQYLERSDGIGVDQRILRLRYGQFLGEEADGAPKPPPTSDGNGLPTADAQTAPAHADEHSGEHAGEADKAATFGSETNVLEEYGHTHDLAEAATLLDPETRTMLKAALDEMWQSELHLRQGQPDRALPYAYKALKFIKQVQQASRIYLARVGPELPPIDESRRLKGERAGIAHRDDMLAAATAADPTLAGLWHALAETPPAPGGTTPEVDFTALERWLRANEARTPDPLAFVAAIETLRSDPACQRCRAQLRALLWPLLPRPAAGVPRRADGDAVGRRYLDALREERAR